MKITNEFDVSVPLAQTWTTMLDVPRVARALPGAKIDPESDGGVYRGTMKIKLGPVTTEYAGTARIEDVDDDDHIARFRVEGREAKGQGAAAAAISLRLSDAGGATHVVVVTDMQVTGRQAQFGRGLMEEVAGAILADFAVRLERELRGGGGEPNLNGAGAPSPRFDDADEALDVSSAVRGPLLQRAALIGGGTLVGIVLGVIIGALLRRRPTPTPPPWGPYPGWPPYLPPGGPPQGAGPA
ncbi:SRPBCC family protein [Conexibacter sp. CPCC 206217]|uniref:SRPBCC family protein n=1 Tax=Conexibacter sp. CPCC 206217 TaxID=3064574 RepID=UPI00271D7C01|nr:SRPBCC family protein [Conexibacter sp. CPCC 206217]MDO8212494.1 SRPBCC family protein [Conexibacter sp. CPCC 206217]